MKMGFFRPSGINCFWPSCLNITFFKPSGLRPSGLKNVYVQALGPKTIYALGPKKTPFSHPHPMLKNPIHEIDFSRVFWPGLL